MSHPATSTLSIVRVLGFATLVVGGACAKAPPTQPPPAPAAPAQAAPAAQPDAAGTPFREEELAALLAPIALYPDPLVAQILMASTYPLEVVYANRWVQQNKNLQGEALAAAAVKQAWDQSVQALTAFPDVLKMMDEKIDWTQQLGDAFLAQQRDVMAMVQTLRVRAEEAGNLKSDEHQTVTVEPAPAASPATAITTTVLPTTTTIIIQPTNPQVIYVPTYSPTVVYGSWGYPAYPPYYFPPPPGYAFGAGLAWGVGVAIGVGIWHGAWDNHCDWHGGDININGDVNINRGNVNVGSGNTNIGSGNRTQARGASATSTSGQSWSHNPEHRKGASYRDSGTAQKYGGSKSGAQASTRDAYRGRSGSGAQTRPSTGAGASASTRNAGGGASAATPQRPIRACSQAGPDGPCRDIPNSLACSSRRSRAHTPR